MMKGKHLAPQFLGGAGEERSIRNRRDTTMEVIAVAFLSSGAVTATPLRWSLRENREDLNAPLKRPRSLSGAPQRRTHLRGAKKLARLRWDKKIYAVQRDSFEWILLERRGAPQRPTTGAIVYEFIPKSFLGIIPKHRANRSCPSRSNNAIRIDQTLALLSSCASVSRGRQAPRVASIRDRAN